jgi:hypothetical protein
LQVLWAHLHLGCYMVAICSACSQGATVSALVVWATAVSIFWEPVFSIWIFWHLVCHTLHALPSVASSTWRYGLVESWYPTELCVLAC